MNTDLLQIRMLLLKPTVDSLVEVTQELLSADDLELDCLTREAVMHFFSEFSFTVIQFIKKDEIEKIEELLRRINQLLINSNYVITQKTVTSRMRIHLQLSTICAVATVYLKNLSLRNEFIR